MRPSRRSVLAGLGAAGLVGLRADADAPAQHLVLVVAQGGWDPTFTIDPKPRIVDGGPYVDLHPEEDEFVAEFGDIHVSLNAARRPSVNRFFETYGHRTAVVNGLWVGSLSHWQSMVQVLTGTVGQAAPDVASVAGGVLGGNLPLATVDMSGVARFGPFSPVCARSGIRGQLTGLLDPSTRFPTPDGPRPSWSPTEADQDAIQAFLNQRMDRELPFRSTEPGWFEAVAERRTALDRAARLRSLGQTLTDGLPVGRRTLLREQIPFAVDLLSKGTCQAVMLGTGFGWDTHSDAGRQHEHWNDTFAGLYQLARTLEEASLLDRTLVAVVSELGRSPRRNAEDGTDHWTYTSAVVFGSSVVGGRKIGGTDEDLIGLGTNPATGRLDSGFGPVSYASFAAGLLEGVGVDSKPWIQAEPLRGFLA